MRGAVVLTEPEVVVAATHPVRAAVLDAMREPRTAADVARTIGQSRQNVAYHVRELAKVGLLRHVGQRQRGTFVEQTYQRVADTLIISPRCTWGDEPRRAEALADQVSLAALFETGQRLQRESAVLLDRAAFGGEEIPSAAVATDVHFASEVARSAFLREYIEVVTALTRRYGARGGDAYRLVLAAYPKPEEDEEDTNGSS